MLSVCTFPDSNAKEYMESGKRSHETKSGLEGEKKAGG